MKYHFLVVLLISVILPSFGQGGAVVKSLSVEKALLRSTQFQNSGDIKEATRYLNEAAIVSWEAMDYNKAIEYFNKSIELNKQINNVSGISKLQSNLGMIYSDRGEYDKSLELFQQSLDYRLSFGEKSEIISTYINKSVVLNNLKRYSDAASNLEEALKLATTMNDIGQMKSCYGMLAETYEKAGNQERTLHYFNLYRTFHEMIARNKVSDAKKETQTAELKSLQLELENKERDIELLHANSELALTEEQLEKLDKKVRDVLANNTKQELAIDVLRREVELSDLRAKQAEAKTRYQEIWLGTIVVGFVGVVSFAFLMYRNSRFKKKINLQLHVQNDEIRRLNDDLEGLVQQRTSELQKTLTNLEKRNSDLQQFSNIISHNLRGPVASILGLGQLLKLDDPADPINGQIFTRLLGVTQNLDAVVKDLAVMLEVKDPGVVSMDDVNLGDAFHKTCVLLDEEIRKSNAIIKTSFSSPTFQSMKVYVESVLFNLISNAIKYKSDGRDPLIDIRSFAHEESIWIVVTDNGMGINTNDLEKIFYPYKRFHAGEGKGLGLYMVKTQIEVLGGSVTATSEKGKGSIFTIILPKNTN